MLILMLMRILLMLAQMPTRIKMTMTIILYHQHHVVIIFSMRLFILELKLFQ